MKSEYIGEASDYWKGAIIQRLLAAKLLEDITIVPMITDRAWKGNEKLVYSRLLNIKANRVYSRLLKVDGRNDYFNKIPHSGDLFLDPDTGVSTDRHDTKYIHVDMIKMLLAKPRRRVILIYQHRSHEEHCEQMKRIIGKVRGEIEKVNATTYACGSVAMLFFSYDRDRIERIEKHLKHMLCDDPLSRVKIWPQ